MSQYESFHLWGEGKLCYDDEKVNRSKDLIKDAEKALDSTKENIAKGFSSLLAAANIDRSPDLAENIRANEPIIEKYPEECISYMEELYRMVKSKQEEIEDYKNANGFKKFSMTLGMAGSKFLEGIASVGENIVDAGATLVGCVGGLFSSDFQDSCAEFIKKDHVGEAFHNFNEWTGINKYSAMSENGTMAKVFKGVGVATGYVALAAATGGTVNAIAGAGTMTATAANTAVAVVGGLGSGMESGLQQGKDWNGALGEGVKTAAIQGATAYAAGKLSEHVQTNKALKMDESGVVDDAVNATRDAKDAVIKAKDNLAKTAVKNTDEYKAAKAALKEAKIDYHTARANQAVLEKGVITGDIGKANEQIVKNKAKAKELIDNISVKNPKTGLVERTVTRTSNIGKAVEGHVGDAISTKAGNITDSAINSVSNKVDKVATKVGNTKVAQTVSKVAADHPVATAFAKLPGETAVGAAKTVVKSGDILAIKNEMAKADRQVIHQDIVQKERLDATAENTIGKDYVNYDGIFTGSDVDYSSSPAATDNGYVPPTQSDVSSSNSRGYTATDPGYTAYQPSVASRQSSDGGYTASNYSTGGGYTATSSGSSYTPSYSATSTSTPAVENDTPMTNSSPTGGTGVTNSNSNGTTSSTTTTTGGSTGNSSAVIDTFSGTTGSSSNGGYSSTSTYTYDEPVRSTTSYSSSGTAHSGGGYSESGYSFSGSDVGSYSDTATSIDPTDLITGDTSMSSSSGTLASSITSTNKFSNQTIKIPTSSESISAGTSNMAIPTAAAFSAAAAAGIGAKAYVDKKEREKEEKDGAFEYGDENSGIYSDNWDGSEDDIKVDYGTEEDETLDDDNSYSADSIIEKYEAVSNSDLEEA